MLVVMNLIMVTTAAEGTSPSLVRSGNPASSRHSLCAVNSPRNLRFTAPRTAAAPHTTNSAPG